MTPHTTLAYVFWHQPRPDVGTEEYESALRAFHARLADAEVPGFLGSWSVRASTVPWLGGGAGYEDRYLVADFTALGELSMAAVAGGQQASHDAAAASAVDGTAGLYRLISGDVQRQATSASWFGKPAGVAYPDFLADLDIGGSALWQRQLTLGPTPEFQATGLAPLPFAEYEIELAAL